MQENEGLEGIIFKLQTTPAHMAAYNHMHCTSTLTSALSPLTQPYLRLLLVITTALENLNDQK